MNWFIGLNPIIQAFVAGIFTWLITALGALLVCFFREIDRKILNTILGFSAGVMIAASFWSLLLPAIDLSEKMGYIVWLLPTIGFIVGGMFVLISDKFLDKILSNTNSEKKGLKKVILLVSAITIHNIPEGMAIGVAFGGIMNGENLIGALMLAIGIGIQNLPEGTAVALPIRSLGYSKFKSFMIGQLSAVVEPIAALLGAIMVIYIRNILPFLLAFAAGAMIIVVARELLPEAVIEHKNLSTYGIIFGFVLMMILDVVFG